MEEEEQEEEEDTNSLLQKVKSPGWHVTMFNIDLQILLWIFCPGRGGVKGDDRADRLMGKANHQKWPASQKIR